jgi:hypothetical protein
MGGLGYMSTRAGATARPTVYHPRTGGRLYAGWEPCWARPPHKSVSGRPDFSFSFPSASAETWDTTARMDVSLLSDWPQQAHGIRSSGFGWKQGVSLSVVLPWLPQGIPEHEVQRRRKGEISSRICSLLGNVWPVPWKGGGRTRCKSRSALCSQQSTGASLLLTVLWTSLLTSKRHGYLKAGKVYCTLHRAVFRME